MMEQRLNSTQALSRYLDENGVPLESLDPRYRYCFSDDPHLWFRSVLRPNDNFKPKGLWFSTGTDPNDSSWLDRCCAENEIRFLKPYLYCLELNRTNMLVCSEPEHLYRISDQFGTERFGDNGEFTGKIDWGKIYDQFSGIEITPYQWTCRLEPRTHWYYSWDCAGGCVWRSDAIESIKLIGTNVSESKHKGLRGWWIYEVVSLPVTTRKV